MDRQKRGKKSYREKKKGEVFKTIVVRRELPVVEIMEKVRMEALIKLLMAMLRHTGIQNGRQMRTTVQNIMAKSRTGLNIS